MHLPDLLSEEMAAILPLPRSQASLTASAPCQRLFLRSVRCWGTETNPMSPDQGWHSVKVCLWNVAFSSTSTTNPILGRG